MHSLRSYLPTYPEPSGVLSHTDLPTYPPPPPFGPYVWFIICSVLLRKRLEAAHIQDIYTGASGCAQNAVAYLVKSEKPSRRARPAAARRFPVQPPWVTRRLAREGKAGGHVTDGMEAKDGPTYLSACPCLPLIP